jgi:hypothetical protein
LPAARVADLIVLMLTLAADVMLVSPAIVVGAQPDKPTWMGTSREGRA